MRASFLAVLCVPLSLAQGAIEFPEVQVGHCADAIAASARFFGHETHVTEDGNLRDRAKEFLGGVPSGARVDNRLVTRHDGILSYAVDDSSLYQLDASALETVRRHVDKVLERREHGGSDVIYSLRTDDVGTASTWLRLFSRERGDFATVADEQFAVQLRSGYRAKSFQWLTGGFALGLGWLLVPVFNVPIAIPSSVLAHLLFEACGWSTANNDFALILTTAGFAGTGVAAAVNVPLWYGGALRRLALEELFLPGAPAERKATSAFWNAAQLSVLQRHGIDAAKSPRIPRFLAAAVTEERLGGIGLSAVALDGTLYVTFY